ncbi:MAG: hypothetical protein ABSB33_03900 [Tepidisphaeraceae bacterium]|jgi:hypothetical protein
MNYRHISIVAALLLLGGCQHYYMVQDPTGGKAFYTDKIDQMDSGAVVFKDLQTGEKMTLQNSAVKEINKSELPPGAVK